MNKVVLLSLTALTTLTCGISLAQQKDEVLMTVNAKPVYRSEFENIYKKNNKEASVTKQALDDYLVLFTNFKLKVTEAEELGMDTVRKFKDELDGYRKQLAKPYLVDNNLTEELVKEAYERMKTEVKASHILVKCDLDALPEDSLKAYKKAMAIYDKLKGGASFETLAVESAKDKTGDESALKNKGELGYFTSMQMVYPFESAAYKLKVGEISKPVRTRYGYHIIKLSDRRPSRGQIRVSHIMIAAKPEDAQEKQDNARKKAEELLEKIKGGADFADLARQYSDDQSSARKGGELPAFGPGRMVPEFEETAFGLKADGDVSQIVKTNYGYHIIKRLELKMLEPYDEKKNEIKQRIQRDSRSFLPKKSFIAKLKTKYKYEDISKSKTLGAFYSVVDTLIFKNEWNVGKAKGMEKPMFKFADKTYTQRDFANYLWKNQRKQKKQDIKNYLNQMYDTYTGDELIAYEDTQLESEYPEFKALMKEYRDGILLFDLTDKKVWSKAVKDTTGLRAYYEEHKTAYMHPERFDVIIYTCKDEATAKKVKDEVAKGKISDEELQKKYNKDSQLNLKVEKGVFTKEEQEVLQKLNTSKSLTDNITHNGQVVFAKVVKVLAPTPKTLSEAKGPVTSDYQNALEKDWLTQLKDKYKVTVNKDVLYSIK